MLKQGGGPAGERTHLAQREKLHPNSTGDYFVGAESQEPPNEKFPDRATMRLRKDIEPVTLAAQLQTAHGTMNAPTHY
jgi:hypothetical protein